MGTSELLGQLGEMLGGILQGGGGGGGVAAFLMNSVSIDTNHDRSTLDTVQGHKAHEDFLILRATVFDFCNLTFL